MSRLPAFFYVYQLTLLRSVAADLMLNIISDDDLNVSPEIECILDMIGALPRHSRVTVQDGGCLGSPVVYRRVFHEPHDYSVYNLRHGYVKTQDGIVILCAGSAGELGAAVTQLRRGRDDLWDRHLKFIVLLTSPGRAGPGAAVASLRAHDVYNVSLIHAAAGGGVLVTCHLERLGQRCARAAPLAPGLCAHLDAHYNTSDSTWLSLQQTIVVAAIENIPNFIFPRGAADAKRGTEQYMLDGVAQALGVGVRYVYMGSDVGLDVGGAGVGILRPLLERAADLVTGGLSLLPARARRLDYVWGLSFSQLLLLTPTTYERGCYVYDAFDETVWWLVAAAFAAAALTLLLAARETSLDAVRVVLRAFGYLVANPHARLARGGVHRFVFVCWLWCTFFLGCFYSTALYNLTVNSSGDCRRAAIADSAQFVNESGRLGYATCVSNVSREFLNGYYSLELRTERRDCFDPEGSLTAVAGGERLFAIETAEYVQLRACRYHDGLGRARLSAASFGSGYLPAMYLQRNSILTHPLQQYLFTFYESGLLQQYQSTIVAESRVGCSLKVKVFQPRTLVECAIPFTVLAGGYVLSALCFALELVCMSLQKYNRRFASNVFTRRHN